MIDPKINKAIHEALGNPIGCPWCSDLECTYNRGPDYCSDLNAMHEAESILTTDQYMRFSDLLYDAEQERLKQTKRWRWLSVTARQRAEALLRTLGKWDDQSGDATEMEVQK